MADSRADQGKETSAEGSVLSDFEKWKSEKMNRETENGSGSTPAGSSPEIVSRGEDRFSEWDDSRMLVPSSLELGAGSVDKYVISKQIVRMQEPRRLTPDDLEERRIIYPESSNRKLVNHFRNLRTKLLEKSGGNNFTLVVSGAREGAGSSFVALNLASL